MKTTLIAAIAAYIVLPANAAMCAKHKDANFITVIGKCSTANCDGFTASRAFKFCKRCSTKQNACEACGELLAKVLAAVPADNSAAITQHDGHFVNNTFRTNDASLFLLITEMADFEKVFGVAAVQGKPRKWVNTRTFENSSVAAIIRRGNSIWTYKVQKGELQNGTLALHFSSEKTPPNPATEFASPMIVSFDRADVQKVEFIENGKSVNVIAIPQIGKPSGLPADKSAEIEKTKKRIVEIEQLMIVAKFTPEGYAKITAELAGLKKQLAILEAEEKPKDKPAPPVFKGPSGKAFPAHWGEPPRIQTRDLRPLPGGYGQGSGTLAKWIQMNLDKDAEIKPVEPKKPDAAPEAAVNDDHGKMLTSHKAWQQIKAKIDGNYSYKVARYSRFGGGNSTEIIVRDNKVVERRYQSANGLPVPAKPAEDPKPNGESWIEKDKDLGKHKEGAALLTLDELYQKAIQIAKQEPPAFHRLYTRFDGQGLLLACLTVDTRIADDVPHNGVSIASIQTEPELKPKP